MEDQVNDPVLSQEDALQTYRTTRQIARETGIHRSSVVRIIRDNNNLYFKRTTYLAVSQSNISSSNINIEYMCVYKYIQTRLKSTVCLFRMTRLSLLTILHSNCKDDNGNKHVTRDS